MRACDKNVNVVGSSSDKMDPDHMSIDQLTTQPLLPGRDTGNDFFVSQISGGSVSVPGTLNVG